MNIEVFDHAVIERDVTSGLPNGGRETASGCLACHAPLGEPHRDHDYCFKYQVRLKARLGMMALSAAFAGHPEIPHDEAEEWFDLWRTLRACSETLPDDLVKPFQEDAERRVAEIVAGRRPFLHLDAGWSGRGAKPSQMAALGAAMSAAIR